MARGPYGKQFTPEQRNRAVELCLWSVRAGWPISRFCRLSGVPKATINLWLTADENFDRYRRAKESQAMQLPDMAMDVVRRVIDGVLVEEDQVVDGQVVKVKRRHFLDPKAGKVALSHFEFRLMREHKARMYANDRQLTVKRDIDDLTDREVIARFEELRRRAIEANAQLNQIEGVARDVTEEPSDDR